MGLGDVYKRQLLDLAEFLNDRFDSRLGDANLDGVVDASDFATINANMFQPVNCGNNWSSGDFNGDGVVDGSDFNIWNDNKFQPAAAANADRVARAPQAALAANARAVEIARETMASGFVHSTVATNSVSDGSLVVEQVVDAAASTKRLRTRNDMGLQSRRTGANSPTDISTQVDDLFSDLGSCL